LKKILIVDSDQQVSAILELKLKQSNFDVKILTRTVNALKTVKEFKPDLIISEMVLPELSGVDFLKRVKMNPDTSNIPFMFLSSSRNVEDKILAHEMGAEAFFMKPIFIKVLIQRIKDFFEQADFNEMLSKSTGEKDYQGDLTNISLIDILNIISESKSTGKIDFQNSAGNKAQIFFRNGSVIRAQTDDGSNKNGEEEIFSILSWLDGSFVMSYEDVEIQRNIRTPHDNLIVNAVNWLDDYTEELSVMPPLDTKLHLNFRKFLTDINQYPDRVSCIIKNIGAEGSRLSDIVDRTELDRKQTVNYLKKLIDSDVVTINKTDTDFILPPKPDWLGKEEKDQGKEEQLDDILDKLSPIDPNGESKKEKDPNKTIVPPPELIDKNTIDPAVDISLESVNGHKEEEQKTLAPKPGLIDSVSLNFGMDESEEPEPPTATPPKEPDAEEMKTILEEHLSEISAENKENRGKIYSDDSGNGKSKVFIIMIFILISGSIAAAYIYFPEKINDLSQMFGFAGNSVEVEDKEEPSPEIEEKKEDEPVAVPEQKEGIVLTDEQKELLEKPVGALMDQAASLYDEEKIEEAVNINLVALYKLIESGEEKAPIYEKVVTNMAIYYYMLDKGEKALKYAEESNRLKEDSKSIELLVAILDFLDRKPEAASLLRSRLDNPGYADKKDEWIGEINRLEKLE
jgi:CheY-like chemotaxis protein/regulatory protein YycI of two-component signal transduction system YycFG